MEPVEPKIESMVGLKKDFGASSGVQWYGVEFRASNAFRRSWEFRKREFLEEKWIFEAIMF